MATAAREEAPVGSAQGRFSFRRCTSCAPDKAVHGYFHGSDGGIAASLPYLTQKEAIKALDGWVDGGHIPAESRDAIVEDIRASGMMEEEPYLGPFTFKIDPELGGIFAGAHPKSEFSPSGGIFSRERAREYLEDGITNGIVRAEERQALLDQIEASELPEKEPRRTRPRGMSLGGLGSLLGIALMSELASEPRREPLEPLTLTLKVGPESEGGPQVGHFVSEGGKIETRVFRSKADAKETLLVGIDAKIIPVEDYDRLEKEINDSALP